MALLRQIMRQMSQSRRLLCLEDAGGALLNSHVKQHARLLCVTPASESKKPHFGDTVHPHMHLSNEEWEKKLSPEQYYVCRERGTETPFTGEYVHHFDQGVYHCICCGAELFSSETKFDSHCGWPSFWSAYGSEADGDESKTDILRRSDNSHGMSRTEVICKKCDSHLGHVFSDGPPPTGERFCINSVALKFRPKLIKKHTECELKHDKNIEKDN